MKRIGIILFVAVLLAGLCGVAQAADSLITVVNPDLVDDDIGVQYGETLTIGMITAPTGIFSTNLWGTNVADLAVRSAVHGYNTITWMRSGETMFDGMAIAGVNVLGSNSGQRTYVISLMTDLVYNDGTPLTAKDYIFSLLLSGSPEVAALGGAARGLEQFAGYDAYLSGEANGIRGIRLLSEDSFSFEINPDSLPYFYGITMLDITPYPMHVIAPGCDILDDGDGCYIGRGADADAMDAQVLGFTPGDFSVEMLRHTLLDPDTGYLYNPRVTSGPYQLEAYNAETKTVNLVINPNHLGNYEGQKAHIERLVLRPVENDSVLELLLSGEIDLVNELVNGDVINEALKLTTGADAPLGTQNYPRSGLAYLALACEDGPTADAAVRTAIAQCVDKTAIIAAASPYAMPVHGYYGMGQWMMNYQADSDSEQGLDAVNIPEFVTTLEVPFDVRAARKTLDAAGWNLNEQGGRYKDGIRYRQGDAGLEPLILQWAKTDSALATSIRDIISPAFAEAGISLEVTEMPFSDVLQHYYRQEAREYDMFFLASDFLQTFDPYYDYHTDDGYQGIVNTSGLRDGHLMTLAKELRQTPAGNQHLYALRWMDFQSAWVEQMPLVPIYSNVYFDFYTRELQDYDIVQNLNWGYAIPYAWLGEPPEPDFPEENTIDGFQIID